MSSTSGQVVVKNSADLEAGIDIIEGVGAPAGGIPPFRLFANDGRTLLFQIGVLGSVNAAGFSAAVKTVTTTYAATGADNLILADATAGAFTITLPPASVSAPYGSNIKVIKVDSTANAVTVARHGSDHINGSTLTSVYLSSQYASLDLTSDGISIWHSLPGVFAQNGANLNTVITTYTATIDDYILLADATGGGFTITLPAASGVSAGWKLHVEAISVSGGSVTVSRAGSDTIEGATTKVLSAQYASADFISDGVSTWYIGAPTSSVPTSALVVPATSVSTTYLVGANDCIVTCDATGGAFTVTLPDCSVQSAGRILVFAHFTNSGNNVTIAPHAGQFIQGAANYTLSGHTGIMICPADAGATNWTIISTH